RVRVERVSAVAAPLAPSRHVRPSGCSPRRPQVRRLVYTSGSVAPGPAQLLDAALLLRRPQPGSELLRPAWGLFQPYVNLLAPDRVCHGPESPAARRR